jgi:flavin reductase (DIM6/NTAB) family NADH-FMN oxidoreductase RutF
VSIHSEHPFMPAESDRSAIRRLRGRLPSPVSLWTAQHTGRPAGLTVSSLLVVDGDPGFIIGILDPLSDLWDALRESGTAAVMMLSWRDRQLAEQFGYVAPAPGGPFRAATWHETEWGPVLTHATAWAGGRLDASPIEVGWGLEVRLRVERIELADERAPAEADDAFHPLLHRRGRYGHMRPD